MFRPPSFGSQPASSMFGAPAPQQPTQSVFGQAVPPSPFAPQTSTTTFGGMQQPQPPANPFSSSSTIIGGGGMVGRSGTSNPTYQPTRELESDMHVTFKSICAMPAYATKSYEELRMEDYACGRKGPSNPFSSGTGAFGATSAFGAAQPAQPQPQQQPQGLFNRPTSTFGFGTPAPSTTSSSFGTFQQPQQQPAGIFGQSQPPSSFFGATQQPQQQPQTTSVFGQPPSTGLFGPSTTTTSTGAFGTTTTPSSFGFGQPQQQTPSSAFGNFGSTALNQPTTSMFGQPPAQQQPTSAFGTTTQSMFGGSSATQPSSGLFNQTAQTTNPSIFGAPKPLFGAPSTAPTTTTTTGQSAFGQSMFGQPPQAPLFGGAQPSTQPATQPSNVFQSTTTQQQPPQQQPFSLGTGFGGTTGSNAPSSTPLFGAAPSTGQTNTNTTSSLFTQKPLFPAATAPSTLGQSTSGTNSMFGSSGNLTSNTTQPTNTSFNFIGAAPSTTNTTNPFNLSFAPQPQQSTPSSIFNLQPTSSSSLHQQQYQFNQPQQQQLPPTVTSIAPPLPAALTNIALQPPKPSTATPAKSTQMAPPTSSWRIKLRETSLAINENEKQQVTAVAPPKPATLVPRRFKTLTIDSPKSVHIVQQPSVTMETPLSRSSVQLSESASKPLKTESLQFGDFFMSPSESVLQKYTTEQLKSVSGFVAGKQGVGQISFLKPVDLSEVNLDDLFHKYIIFSQSQVVVYPDTNTKMPPGKGLNQPAEIRLERCWPVNRSTRLPITDPTNERHKQHIERLKAVPDTQFVDFQNDSGTWIFKVDHFSGYGVPEEFRVVDDMSSFTKSEVHVNQQSIPRMNLRRPTNSPWQGQFRTSMDCHGRIVSIQGSTISLIQLEESTQISESQIITLIRNPRSNTDIALLLDAKSSDRRVWLGRALKRWSSNIMNRTPVHAALISGDFVAAEREAARMNRPWLAALLASDAKVEQDINCDGFDEVTKLALSLLKGKVDGVSEKLGWNWLVDYAIRYLYSGSTAACKPDYVYVSFPNSTRIPSILSCLLLNKPAVFHPMAFKDIISAHYPDMLIPYLANRELQYNDEFVMHRAYEQLLFLGFYNAAALLLTNESSLMISHFSRFPLTNSINASPVVVGISSAWAFHANRDHEAEFDAWMMAEQCEKACLVLLNHLADQYVLTGEHGRLKARLLSLTPCQHPDLTVYRLYVQVRLDRDQSAAKNLTTCLDSRSAARSLSLLRRIAFAEMAAACSEQGFMSKCLPPELRLLQCHRILQL